MIYVLASIIWVIAGAGYGLMARDRLDKIRGGTHDE